ncbi:MAG: hypothetical protein JKY15_07080, partial [Deltaproteobacteria bacterium]|nr:hypothetical protein [Deltaproteobacteria bacterium]
MAMHLTLFTIALSLALSQPALCWNNHAILSKLATDNFKGLSPKNKVKAEPLESFLKSDWQKIIKL